MDDITSLVFQILIIILGYAILIPLTNMVLASFNIKIPWFKPKKYKNKKSPIYEMCDSKTTFNCAYKVYKWELGWSKLNEDDRLYLFLIPFSGLFIFYRYGLCDESFGEFSETDVLKLPFDFSLEEYYEAEYVKKYKESLEEKIKENNIRKKLDNFNNEFDNNYMK